MNAANRINYIASIFIFLVISSLIIIKSTFDRNGYLSPDSATYLALAQNLLEGNGFATANDGRIVARHRTFVTWPIGYPAAISMISVLTGASVFWASKIVNIIFVGATITLFTIVFGRKGYLYSATLTFGAYLEVYSYTWSEVPFIFFLASLPILLFRMMVTSYERFLRHLFLLLGASTGLFLFRYIGAFAIIPMGFLAAHFAFSRQYKKAAFTTLALAAFGAFILIYFYYNRVATGFSTGPRISAPESNLVMIKMVVAAFISEAALPLARWNPGSPEQSALLIGYALLIVAIFVLLRNEKGLIKEKRCDSLWISLSMVGGIYWVALISSRWATHFDILGFRLMAPGTLLILLGIIRWTEMKFNRIPKAVQISIVSTSVVSLMTNLFLFNFSKEHYDDTISSVLREFASVEKGAIVIFANDHLAYLRTDIHRASPTYPPYFLKRESMSEFLGDLGRDSIVYIRIPDLPFGVGTVDNTVGEFVSGFEPGKLILLRRPELVP